MKTFALNNSWDLYLDPLGNIAIKEGKSQIAQDVASSCRVWKGEDIWDNSRGVPYKEEVMGRRINISMIQALYGREARRIEGVVDTQVIVSELDNRVLKPDIIAITEDGDFIDV